jgi:hypothetical protein
MSRRKKRLEFQRFFERGLFDNSVKNECPFPAEPVATLPYRPRKPNDDAEEYCLWRLGRQRDSLRDAIGSLRPTDPEFRLLSERLARAEYAFDLQSDEVLQTVSP